MSRPEVAEIWPVKRGMNLTCKEIFTVENKSFRLPKREVISPRRVFQDHLLHVDLSTYVNPAFLDEAPKRH